MAEEGGGRGTREVKEKGKGVVNEMGKALGELEGEMELGKEGGARWDIHRCRNTKKLIK